MSSLQETKFFVEVELIALDEHLNGALIRTEKLKSVAMSYQDFEAVERLASIERLVRSLQRRLQKL